MSIVDILEKKKIISSADAPALRIEIEKEGGNEEKVLLRHGVKFEDLLKSKAEFLGIPHTKIETPEIPIEVLKFIPEESAVHYKMIPLSFKRGVLEVGMVHPDDLEARDALNFLVSKAAVPFKIFLIEEADFEKASHSYKGISGEVTEALSELESELSDEEAKIVSSLKSVGDTEESGSTETKIIEDAPVTKIVATILHYSVDGDASDIHIEPMDDKVRVRFRVDGVLNTSLILPLKVHAAVVARIKILSNIRLDEKRKPQDGRFTARIENRRIDFRVSTFPVFYGEKVEMRILDSEKGVRKLDDIGLSKRDLGLIRAAIDRPYGLILISGPTGSGKTTTLYSMLNELDRDTTNVLSLEDPVEYNISGMNQSQVRPEIGYTFANGLRTTLRQDPDIIMVGEIRDKETAQLAVQAALTGHLVLSTIHTNSAVGVIPRLVDMGVDPFLIAPTLILAMAQRLVRRLCPGAGKAIPIEGSIKMLVDRQFTDIPTEFRNVIPQSSSVYEASPTPDCPRGIRGRMAVFETLEMTRELEAVLLKSPTEPEVYQVARKQGMITMKEDALIKCFNKEVPFEEVNKL